MEQRQANTDLNLSSSKYQYNFDKLLKHSKVQFAPIHYAKIWGSSDPGFKFQQI